MANPVGVNSGGVPTGHYVKKEVYGKKGQAEILRKSAKLAGAQGSTSAIETPRRAQRSAQTGGSSAPAPESAPQAGTEPLAVAPPSGAQPAVPELPYPVRVMAAWQEIAANPEATPLMRQYAEAAVQAANRG